MRVADRAGRRRRERRVARHILRKVTESETALLDLRADMAGMRKDLTEHVAGLENKIVTLRADLPRIIAEAVSAAVRYGGAIEAAIGKAKAMRDHATVAASDGVCISSRARRCLGRQRSNRRERPPRRSPAGWRRRSRELIGGLDDANAGRRRTADA